MKRIWIILILMIMIIFISGCVSDECKDLEKHLKEVNMTCKCRKGTVVPEPLSNRSDVKPMCFCVCLINGKWQTVSIVQTIDQTK